jgi:predicted dehydrogenase
VAAGYPDFEQWQNPIGAVPLRTIGIGIVGGGYMGKAHAVAMSAVGAVFETALRPRLEMVCATTDVSAERYRAAFGFARATADWRVLVADPLVEAVVIASPQAFHRDIALAAFALGKPVFCEKPLGATLADSRAMVAAVGACVNMVGFNYIRTPASQYARHLVASGQIGDVTWAGEWHDGRPCPAYGERGFGLDRANPFADCGY